MDIHKDVKRNISNLGYADDTTLMAESEKKLKSHLMRVKEESEKAGLKFNIQTSKIMAFNPITSWQIHGGKVETVTNFIFLGSKITKIKDTPWKKSYDKPSVLKSKDTTWLTKVCMVKAMVFPKVMYGCESWTIEKAEHQRTDAFKL